MANKAQTFFCFEALAASYEKQSYPDLETILELYRSYEDEVLETTKETNEPIQLPSISRLRDLDPSNPSTPSTTSVNSSRTQLSNNTSGSEIAPSYASRLLVTESYPLFVTWNTLSKSGHKSLRGCIGTFEALPLEKGLETYALTSAFEDTRFSPIPKQGIPHLSCSLTLLADFEECDGPMDWELGKHGIRISFMYRYRRHGATYLPDVAVEQGWTKEETLESLMRKAGWDSRKPTTKPWEDVKEFRVIRYTGLKTSGTYKEWNEWHNWAQLKRPELWS